MLRAWTSKGPHIFCLINYWPHNTKQEGKGQTWYKMECEAHTSQSCSLSDHSVSAGQLLKLSYPLTIQEWTEMSLSNNYLDWYDETETSCSGFLYEKYFVYLDSLLSWGLSLSYFPSFSILPAKTVKTDCYMNTHKYVCRVTAAERRWKHRNKLYLQLLRHPCDILAWSLHQTMTITRKENVVS